MKWLRVWAESEYFSNSDSDKVQTGVVVGVCDDSYLMVRLDNGKVDTLQYDAVLSSVWVSDPAKKVSMPKVKR
jgi:hypothetical protein